MNKKGILCTIILLVIIGVGYFVAVKFGFKLNRNIDTGGLTYYCSEGSFKASYGTSSVSLYFPNNKKMVIPQAISASGIRYEFGSTTFWSKGDNAFLIEGTTTTYSKCVIGNITTQDDTNIYSDFSKSFSFSLPKNFKVFGSDVGFTQDWRSGSVNFGNLFVSVEIQKNFFEEKTNFGGANFTIGASSDPDAINRCTVGDNGSTTTGEVLIGNRKFTKINFTDAGAGNYYDVTSYRTIYNDQCYAIEYVIHSTNINNYSSDQGVKEFDKSKVVSVLESMVNSFTFLQNENK